MLIMLTENKSSYIVNVHSARDIQNMLFILIIRVTLLCSHCASIHICLSLLSDLSMQHIPTEIHYPNFHINVSGIGLFLFSGKKPTLLGPMD